MNNLARTRREGLREKIDSERVVYERIVPFGEQASQEAISSVSAYNLIQDVKDVLYHLFRINHTHKYKP